MSGINTQLSPSMPLTMNPPPAVASDLSSTYKFTTFITEVQEPSATPLLSTVSTAFPYPVCPPCLPCTELTPMPAQEPVFSCPSPTSLDALAEYFFDGPKHRTPTTAMLLPLSDRATQLRKEAPVSPSTRPRYSTRPRSPAPSSLRMPSHRWS